MFRLHAKEHAHLHLLVKRRQPQHVRLPGHLAPGLKLLSQPLFVVGRLRQAFQFREFLAEAVFNGRKNREFRIDVGVRAAVYLFLSMVRPCCCTAQRLTRAQPVDRYRTI